MMKLRYFIFSFFLAHISFSQQAKVDSLCQKLSEEMNDYKKLSILVDICEFCEINDNLKYGTIALDLINKLKITTKDKSLQDTLLKQEAFVYLVIGTYYDQIIYYNNNKIHNESKALENYSKSLNIYKQLKAWTEIEETISAIENLHLRKGNVYLQLQNLKEAFEYGKLNDNKTFMARYIYRIALFYANIGDSTKAIQCAEDGVALEKKINNPKRLARGYELGADLFLKINNAKKAIEFYNIALHEYNKNNDNTRNAFIYLGLGKSYASIKNYKESVKCLKQAISYTDSLSKTNALYTEIVVELGRVEYQFGNYTSANYYHQLALKNSEYIGFPGGIASSAHEIAKNLFQLKKYSEAKKYAELSLSIKQKITSVEQIMHTEKLCYNIDSALGNHKNALSHYITYTQLQNKLNLDEIKKSTMKEDLENKFNKEKEREKLIQDKKELETTAERKQQKYIRNGLLIGLLLLCIVASIILRNFIAKKKLSNELIHKNNEIIEQKQLIEEKQNEILDSITYAKRLQLAILPPNEFINQYLSEYFILYKPKDIVAGDFYWSENIGNLFFIAAADSTGHGVPGAMVSVVCSNALNRTIKEFKLTETGKILEKTRELVIETFEKSTNEVKDGMDISLLCIDTENKNIYWSGANNSLLYIQEGILNEIKADKQPIGKTDHLLPFTTHKIEYKKNTCFYLFTDGLSDQFGGPKGKKFKNIQFKELLITINHKPLQEQKTLINQQFENWKGTLEQVDDICVIGIKF